MKNGTNMNCRFVHNHLLAYIENSLPEKIKGEVGEHIATCQKCSVLYTNVRDTYLVTSNIAQPVPPPFFANRVMARYKARFAAQTDVLHRTLRVFQPVAATVLLLLGISAGIYLGRAYTSMQNNGTGALKVEQADAYSAEYFSVSGVQDLAVLLDND